jgi:hypothetical protein
MLIRTATRTDAREIAYVHIETWLAADRGQTVTVNNKLLLLRQKPPQFTCTLLALYCKSLIINGAGEGNRTLVTNIAV